MRCFVVGMGGVAHACTEHLVRSGVKVLGIHSPDHSLDAAAVKQGLRVFPTLEEFRLELLDQPYDYLFSLNNPWIIPAEVLDRPGQKTINFHDSPLPKYAGLHATSWALMHGETGHGVTFHEVTTTIDAGAIVKQRVVPVETGDTAFSLNARCLVAAVGAFAELIAEIRAGTVRATAQPQCNASYFGRRDRPPRAATLDFAQSADTLCNLVRALDYGPVPNPLGLAKLFLGSEFVVVRNAVPGALSPFPPGTVVANAAIGDDHIEIATSTRTVRLSGFSELGGDRLGAADVVERGKLSVGRPIAALDETEAGELSDHLRRVCVFEPQWVERLRSANVPKLPFRLDAVRSAGASTALNAFADALSRVVPEARADAALACVAAFFLTLCDEEEFDFGLSADLPQHHLKRMFASWVPLRLENRPGQSFGEFSESFLAAVRQTRRHGTYVRDLFARYPDMRGQTPPRFSVGLAPGRAASIEPDDAELGFRLSAEGIPEVVHHGRLQAWQIESIDTGLAAFAEQALEDPNRALSSLPLVSPQDHRRMVDEWNRTAAPFPNRCVHELFSETAARYPSVAAVRFGGRSLSYQEVEQSSDGVAARLAVAGVGRGDVVALSLGRSAEIVVAMLGILKAGAAYVPIEPSYPDERIQSIVDDAGARVMVTSARLEGRFIDMCEQVLTVDADAREPEARPRVEVRPDDLAYVIYTSGSTGPPKGVEISHRGLVNHSTAIAANYALTPGDNLLLSASISFDVAGEQIYPALFTGAEVVVRPDDLFESFSGFNEFVGSERITAAVLPTAFWHEWVRELEIRNASPPPCLRTLSVGTEKALGQSLAAWQRLSEGKVRFFQGYGPTETTITCTMFKHDGSHVDPERPLSIGRPLPNTKIYVLDSQLRPIPLGAAGEVFVGGVGLARGYRNNPELTAARFIPSPFELGERLYRTGDMGRFEPEGDLVFLGRRDFQVKVRGFRVELGEIEQALRLHPEVDEAVVLLRTDYGAPELIGYVVANRADMSVDDLLQFARQRLPEYMVPRTVVPLSSFPQTSNQKVDRRAFPTPPRAARAAKGDEKPRTPLEKELLDIWQKYVPGPEIGVHDEFFALGGDSLVCIAMLSEVEHRFQRSVPLSQFVARPTVEYLAGLLTGDYVGTSLVVRIQEGTARPPLWVVHPVGGHVVYAQTLRRHMDPSQPIWGLQARGLDGREQPLESVQDMAELYEGLIRAEQPQGPYFVAGPSMGGLIALEIAQRLQRSGQTVAMLAMLDTWGPRYPRPTSRLVRLTDQMAAVLAQPDWRSRYRLLRERRSKRQGPSWSHQGSPPGYKGLGDAVVSPEMRNAIEGVTLANERANANYRPEHYEGRILLLRAEQTVKWSGMRFDAAMNGWGALALGGVQCITISCSHIELADDPPPEAARVLQRELDRSHRESALTLSPS